MLPWSGTAYKTPSPMMQIRDAFVRGFIWTFHSMGMGKAAKIKSVAMFKAYVQRSAKFNGEVWGKVGLVGGGGGIKFKTCY